MNAAPATNLETTAAPGGVAVVWAFDPWRERPRVALLATACALGLCALVVTARLPFVLAAGLGIACVASFSPALTPVECRADACGASRRGLLGWERRRWEDVRRLEELPAGVLLSAHARRHWLDATRAMVLPMPAARRGELRAALDALRSGRER
jgi:hypothetical protein